MSGVKHPQNRPLLVCDSIEYAAGGQTILQDCSFSLAKGELVALIGPNGAGKTSVLRAIVGALPVSGAISVNGNRLASLAAAERAQQIAYLPQKGQIHWPMQVRDIVALGRLPVLRTGNASSVDPSNVVETIMTRCRISHLADRNATTLSGGERARVLLARALATQARLLLADEPLASLDPRHQLDTMVALRRYTTDGSGVIVVMHDIAMSLRFADRIIVMNTGRIVADGKGEQLLKDGIFDEVFDVSVTPLFDDKGAPSGISTNYPDNPNEP